MRLSFAFSRRQGQAAQAPSQPNTAVQSAASNQQQMLNIPYSGTNKAPNTNDLPPSYNCAMQAPYADIYPPYYTTLPQSMQLNMQPAIYSVQPNPSYWQAPGMAATSVIPTPLLQQDYYLQKSGVTQHGPGQFTTVNDQVPSNESHQPPAAQASETAPHSTDNEPSAPPSYGAVLEQ